jgi:hypothetical protein
MSIRVRRAGAKRALQARSRPRAAGVGLQAAKFGVGMSHAIVQARTR